MSSEELLNEKRGAWADAARYTHWVGIAFLGSFLVPLINAIPPKFTDTSWQLTLISLVISNGGLALLGALFICLAGIFNSADRQIQKRLLRVRSLASWIALGWLLLIPLQLFLGVRLINSQISTEIEQINTFERITRAVRNSNTESQLRAIVAQVPNTPPLPRLTVPLEVAKANLLDRFQTIINTAKNKQQDRSSKRWQTWITQAIRNTLQCIVYVIGFLAIGKNRIFNTGVRGR